VNATSNCSRTLADASWCCDGITPLEHSEFLACPRRDAVPLVANCICVLLGGTSMIIVAGHPTNALAAQPLLQGLIAEGQR